MVYHDIVLYAVCDITGGMWVWGSNVNGQLGVGRLQDGNSIVPVTVFIDGSAPREADDVMAGFNRHAAEEREWKRWAKRCEHGVCLTCGRQG